MVGCCEWALFYTSNVRFDCAKVKSWKWLVTEGWLPVGKCKNWNGSGMNVLGFHWKMLVCFSKRNYLDF